MSAQRPSASVATLALGGALLLAAPVASAYCRTTTCDPTSGNEDCKVDAEGCATAGHPLYWPESCTSYSVADDGSELHGISYDELQALADKAVAHWMGAECPGGGTPDLVAQSTGPAECRYLLSDAWRSILLICAP